MSISPAPAATFGADDMAILAAWLAVAAEWGYGAGLQTCEDGAEWVGITPPGAREDLWHLTPTENGDGVTILGATSGGEYGRASDIRAALRFVAPLPPYVAEPLPIPGGRVPCGDLVAAQEDREAHRLGLYVAESEPARPTLH